MSKGIKIVLMGVDNSGKTTLARNLREVLINKGFSFDYSPPLGKAPLERQTEYLDKILFDSRNVIMDRFPIIEEEVVGRILRGGSNFDKVNKERIFNYYNSIDMIIFCNPPMDVITNWGTRPQMAGVKENVDKLQARYEDLFFDLLYETIEMPVVFFEYDWKNDIVGKRCHEILESIVEMLEEKGGEENEYNSCCI